MSHPGFTQNITQSEFLYNDPAADQRGGNQHRILFMFQSDIETLPGVPLIAWHFLLL